MKLKIYKTEEGELVDFGWLANQFIQSYGLEKEFDLFKQAIIEEEIEYEAG